MPTFVLRLWVTDRPGSLGQVAAAIGAAGADVVGIEILERGGANAVDEITVEVPDGAVDDAKSMLLDRLREVEGVAVEDIRLAVGGHHGVSASALEAAAVIAEAGGAERLVTLCRQLVDIVGGSWAVVLTDDGTEPLAGAGDPPDLGWLSAFVLGSRHLDAHPDHVPSDLAWARLPRRAAVVVVSRSERPYHARERHSVTSLARVADACD
jgi:hypothetical protein